MTPNEAASALGVSRRTVERAIKSGLLRARQGNDRVWSIEPEAFDRWAEAHAPRTRQRMRHNGDARISESHAQELRITQERVAQLEAERDHERAARAAAEAEGRERVAKVEAMLEREAVRAGKAEARAEAAEAELVRLRERQDAVAEERWQEVSERLAQLAPPPEAPRRGWWARWRLRSPG